MPIINKGIFDTDTVFTRQTGNDWPTAQVITTSDVVESTSLYFTNARAILNVIPAITELLVTAPGMYYSIDQYTGNNPSIDVRAGETIAFGLNNPGHPFMIRVSAGGANYDTGLTHVAADGTISTGSAAQGKESGRLFWKIPYSLAGSTYVYQCSIHSGMVGSIVISKSINSTTDLPEGTNLYYTNTRVVSALIPGTAISIESNGRISANVSGIVVQAASQVNNLDNLTTANLAEGTNLYYTNARVRTAFTAGRGIIITDNGIVKSTIGSELFNPAINYAKDYNVTASMAAGLTIPSNPVNDRYILRSLHVTNISDSVAFVSSNVLYAGGNTAYLGSLIPVPVGSVVEFMDRPQLIQPGDKINLQGFNASQTATSGVLSSYFTYESISSDVTYVGTGQTLALSNTTIQVVHADQSDTIIESLKVVNLKTYPIPVKVFFGYSNATPKAYMAFNMQVPPNTSIELLQSPKLILQNDKIYASYANASDGDAISIFPSYRQGSVTNLGTTTASASSGGNIDVSFYTTLVDGTTLYYTLE
jgi:plastocyanin